MQRTNTGLFLDFDGTLVDFALPPAAVRADARLIGLLTQLATTLHGSLALTVHYRHAPQHERATREFAPLQFPDPAALLDWLQDL